jgi:hypothetical protein
LRVLIFIFIYKEKVMKKTVYGFVAAFVLAAGFFACDMVNDATGGGDLVLNGAVAIDGGSDGGAQVGTPLTANTAGLEGTGGLTFQWQRGDTADGPFADIEGANGASYTPVAADAEKYIRVVVSRAGYIGTKTRARWRDRWRRLSLGRRRSRAARRAA